MTDGNKYVTSDKIYAPYLLSMSMNGHLSFRRSFVSEHKLFFEFEPKVAASELVTALETKTEPQIHLIDLFTAISYFWKQVSEAKC